MSDSRALISTLPAWLSTGAVVAVLSWLGFANNTQPVPDVPQRAEELLAESPVYPSVSGTVSLPASRWEDPFAHAKEAAKIEKVRRSAQRMRAAQPDSSAEFQPTEESVSQVRDTIAEKLPADGRVMFMVASVPGGQSHNELERRRRRRHALELALANQGFGLAFPDRMTYRRFTYDFHFAERGKKDAADEDNSAARPLSTKNSVLLPTKLFQHKQTKNLILVTWIQDQHLGKRPITTLRKMHEEFGGLQSRAAFCLMGPTWSGTLKNIIRDAARCDSDMAKFFSDFQHGAVICNSLCTATDDALQLSRGSTHVPIGNQRGLRLIHTIGSDDHLIGALRRELEIRGVWPASDAGNRMVLFTEQSSRNYVESLQTEFLTSHFAKPIVIPYLKGIASDEPQDAAMHTVEDYLERSLAELTSQSSARSIKPSAVRVVGIFGSQWDDKNIILKKAREVFPVATFFTTELDAQYNSPEGMPHSRNLVVASHFGLWIRLGGEVFPQADNIPSFRDGYQTSSFIGTSVICSAFLTDCLKQKEYKFVSGAKSQDLFDLVGRQKLGGGEQSRFARLRPSLFEIGSQAIQLPSQMHETANSNLPLRQPQGTRSIHQVSWIVGASAIGLIISVLVFNFLADFSKDAKELRKRVLEALGATLNLVQRFITGETRTSPGNLWPIASSICLGLLIVGVTIASEYSVESEPIQFTTGISIWPSIWGLYLVIALSTRELRDIFSEGSDLGHRKARHDATACKLAGTIVVGFYLISFLESGGIVPPARHWAVRWLADGLLFIASTAVLLVTSRCLLFSLDARKTITGYSDSIASDVEQGNIVEHCQETMALSIRASWVLMGPAVLSVLFVAARWRGWDAWGLDRTWYVLFGIPIFICLLAAMIVRMTAIDFRNKVLDHLRNERFRLVTNQAARKPHAVRTDSVQLLQHEIDEVAALSRGPFGPIAQDYLLGSAALFAAVAVSGPVEGLLQQLLSVVR